MAEKYGLKEKLKRYPEVVLYGEVYGSKVQDLQYGCAVGEREFVVFDALDAKTKRYFERPALEALCRDLKLDLVPTIYSGPWSEAVPKLADGFSTVPGAERQIREGICVRSVPERYDTKVGRAHLKIVSEAYLLRKEGK
jgi:RNA ligase (TIGR02306 family)